MFMLQKLRYKDQRDFLLIRWFIINNHLCANFVSICLGSGKETISIILSSKVEANELYCRLYSYD